MKTLFKATLIAAIAVVSLASCNREKESPVTKNDVHFVLKAKMPATRTGAIYGEGSYEPYFQKGDNLGVLFTLPTASADLENDAVFSNTQDDGADAEFEGTVSLAEGEGITFYSYYPAAAGKKVYYSNDVATLGIDVPSGQAPAYHDVFGYSFDPAADILIAQPATCSVVDVTGFNDVDMYFSRITGVLRVALNMNEGVTGYGERVSKFVIETSAGDIAGRVEVNPVTGEYVGTKAVSNSKKIMATYDLTAADAVPVYVGYESINNVFLCTAPVTIPAGSALTFTVETVDNQGQDAHKIVKTITSTPKDIVFRSGEPAVINLNIVESEVGLPDSQDPNDYSGEYLITNTGHTYAAKAFESGNNNLRTVAITYQNDLVTYEDDVVIDNCKMTITKVTTGEYAGMYTIQDANALYLHPASSGSNYLRGYSAESLDKNGYWTITNTDGAWTIVATKSEYTRNEMRFNGTIVACYASGQSPVDLVSWSKVAQDTTPQIIVAETQKSVAADAQSVEFAFTTKNIEGNPTATVTTDNDHIVNGTPTFADGKVIIALNPNTQTQEKNAVITLSYEGAQSVALTIIQAAYCEWTLVTNVSQLEAGDQLVIASPTEGKVANSTLTGGYLGEATATFSSDGNGISELTANALILTLGGESGAWTLSNASNQKLGATAAKALAFNSGKTNWSISIDASGATIQNETSSYGRILHNVGGTRFTTYTSSPNTSMLLPQLYRKPGVPDTRIEVTMSFNPAEPAAITLGDDFTEPTLTVSPADAAVEYSVATTPSGIATIGSDGELTITGAGTITVTASVADEETYKPASASYTLTVNVPLVVHGSVDNPETISSVLTVIEGMTNGATTTDFYYVGGTLNAAPSSYVSSTGTLTFTISDGNGHILTIYKCLGLEGAKFAGLTDLKKGDYVVVYGNLKKYVSNSTTTPEIVDGKLAKLTPYSGTDGLTATFTFSTMGYSNGESVSDVTKDDNNNTDITLEFDLGNNTNGNAPKYYNTGSGVRMYGNNTLVVDGGDKTIKEIAFTFDGTYTGTLGADTGEYTKPTWSGSASKVTFTNTGSTNRIKKIVVTYE